MAIEFRNRGWLDKPAALESTATWLRGLEIALVGADELLHEYEQKDDEQTGPPKVRVFFSLPDQCCLLANQTCACFVASAGQTRCAHAAGADSNESAFCL
jgi:hypothetical protein